MTNTKTKSALSGEWVGWYAYEQELTEQKMSICLHCSADGRLNGEGIDDIGHFYIYGSYRSSANICYWRKIYSEHYVEYKGVYEGQKIQGKWWITDRELELSYPEGTFCLQFDKSRTGLEIPLYHVF